MGEGIRHRRLHAFFYSKVLNSLMIVTILGILVANYCRDMMLPLMCSGLAFLFFAGYTVWFWIKKPERIVINRRLSNINGFYTYYFLIVAGLKAENVWWYIVPAVCAVAVLFVMLVKPGDEEFEINA